MQVKVNYSSENISYYYYEPFLYIAVDKKIIKYKIPEFTFEVVSHEEHILDHFCGIVDDEAYYLSKDNFLFRINLLTGISCFVVNASKFGMKLKKNKFIVLYKGELTLCLHNFCSIEFYNIKNLSLITSYGIHFNKCFLFNNDIYIQFSEKSENEMKFSKLNLETLKEDKLNNLDSEFTHVSRGYIWNSYHKYNISHTHLGLDTITNDEEENKTFEIIL